MASGTLLYTIFYSACNNFKVNHTHPGENTFNTIKSRYFVEDDLVAEVLEHKGERELKMRNSFSSSRFPDVAHVAVRVRPDMNTDNL